MKYKDFLKLFALLLCTFLFVACSSASEKQTELKVSFTNLKEGDTVTSPVALKWSVENFVVEPVGDGTVHEGKGHLHIIVDTPCVAVAQTIPKDETHLHFGDGSMETSLILTEGKHSLCLQAADSAHTALSGDGATQIINITVSK